MNYETILKNFQRGLWTSQMVHIAVNKGVITEEQYESIIENRPISVGTLTEVIDELNEILDGAEAAMIEGVESIA